jgi:hypothetical protein
MRSFATLASYLSIDVVSFTDYFAQAMHLVIVVWYISHPRDESYLTSQVTLSISVLFSFSYRWGLAVHPIPPTSQMTLEFESHRKHGVER